MSFLSSAITLLEHEIIYLDNKPGRAFGELRTSHILKEALHYLYQHRREVTGHAMR